MPTRPLDVARTLSERDGPFLFFDAGHEGGESSHFVDPVDVCQSVRRQEVLEWAAQHLATGRFVAGFLGFEWAWELDDLRADRKSTPYPDLWIGAFDQRIRHDGRWLDEPPAEPTPDRLPVGEVAPAVCDVDSATYQARVQAGIDAVFAGELFEVNYTERFRRPWRYAPFALYERLRERCTGRFFGYLQTDRFAIGSVSPEEFLRVDERAVSTRPIKGTRRRGRTEAQDRDAAQELLESEKDRAENVMIVDLMRNDLTRFCTPGTVRASRICEVETFAGWHHLVSTVEGELSRSTSPFELLGGCFPAGSITGAPKLRSIELIAELESSARGPYTGTLFWADASTLRSNVLIRTAAVCDGQAEYGAGGAVVSDSEPAAEYEEARLKAAPFLALGGDDGP